MTNVIQLVFIILGGVVAFGVWLAQGIQTRARIRRVLFNDIHRWRESLKLMDKFFENLRDAIEKKEARMFQFERSQFPINENLISQLHLLSDREIEVIHAFYEYYRTFETDVVSVSRKLNHWDNLRKEGNAIDEHQRQSTLYGLGRALKIRELLLLNTEGRQVKDFGANYQQPLLVAMETTRQEIANKTGVNLL